MSQFIQNIRTEALNARKAAAQDRGTTAQVTATLLMTLLSDIQMVGKNNGGRETTQDEALKMARKFLGGAEESLALLSARQVEGVEADPQIAQLTVEISVLTALLAPFQVQALSPEALKEAIEKIVQALPAKNPKAMGAVMKALKDEFNGRYDGTVAGALVKAALAG